MAAARVVGEVMIDLPRPRRLEMAEQPVFGGLAGQVRRLLKQAGTMD